MKNLIANRKLLIIGGAIALLLFGVGYLVVPSGLPKPIHVELQVGQTPGVTSTPTPQAPELPVAPIRHVVPKGQGIMFPLKERVVNLADPGGYRYLRVSIVLEFLPKSAEFYRLPSEKRKKEEDQFKQELMRQKPVIDDIVTYVLSSKTFADVFTIEGKERLKKELMEKLNASLGEGKYVGAVYFTDFVIQ
ncbi:MAG: flagellar basal body-associated FliL family protein [Anaerolineae bacterium]|nr:flagellar basal body-associated FliL family protein [Anaerolineae bacterium]